jgi:hypothetical protein
MLENTTITKLEVKLGSKVKLRGDTSLYNIIGVNTEGERKFVVSPIANPRINFRVSINQISHVLQ